MPNDIREDFYEWSNRMNDYLSITDIFQTPKYLLLQANLGNKELTKILGIYNKKSKKLFFCQPLNSKNSLLKGGLINDIDAGPMFFPVKMINDKTMAMIISAKQLKEYVKSNDFIMNSPKIPEKKKRLEELANNITESDNPILVLAKFK